MHKTLNLKNMNMMKKVTPEDYDKGFSRGYLRLEVGQRKDAEEALANALGVSGRASVWRYRMGISKCTAAQAARVERVFASFGIADNVWGDFSDEIKNLELNMS